MAIRGFFTGCGARSRVEVIGLRARKRLRRSASLGGDRAVLLGRHGCEAAWPGHENSSLFGATLVPFDVVRMLHSIGLLNRFDDLRVYEHGAEFGEQMLRPYIN